MHYIIKSKKKIAILKVAKHCKHANIRKEQKSSKHKKERFLEVRYSYKSNVLVVVG